MTPILTKKWAEKFSGPDKYVLALDSLHNTNMQKLISLVKKAASDKTKKLEARGASNPTIQESLWQEFQTVANRRIINRLVGRNVAEVGNKPGVTKGQRWLKTSANIQVLDTPGILWPKFSDQTVGYKLAAFGAIKDSIFHADDVALYVLERLREYYLKDLIKFSKLNSADIENLSDADILLAMTEKYGMRDDYDRFSLFMLQRLRKGAIGRITLDRPDEYDN